MRRVKLRETGITALVLPAGSAAVGMASLVGRVSTMRPLPEGRTRHGEVHTGEGATGSGAATVGEVVGFPTYPLFSLTRGIDLVTNRCYQIMMISVWQI